MSEKCRRFSERCLCKRAWACLRARVCVRLCLSVCLCEAYFCVPQIVAQLTA